MVTASSNRPTEYSFTERIVGLVLVGILVTVGILFVSRAEASSRDAHKAEQMNLISLALETYYNQYGQYPDCYSLMQPPRAVGMLLGLKDSAVTSPNDKSGTNSFGCEILTTASSPNSYAYVGDGSKYCADPTKAGSCLQYTLQYYQESTQSIVSIPSHHRTAISISGSPSLFIGTVTSSSIGIKWNQVPGSLRYDVALATDEDFTTGVIEQSTSNLSTSFINLPSKTLYFVRVKAFEGGVLSKPSNIIRATTK